MAQSSNYGKIKLNEHRPQSYSSIEVQSDEPDKSLTYHNEDDNKQPSHTLLENQQFTDTESSTACNKVTSMVNPEVDTTRPYTTVEHITVVTDLSPTYYSDPDQTHVCCLMYDEDPPDNASYLCLALFAICCCCWPCAGVAVCNASQYLFCRHPTQEHVVMLMQQKDIIRWLILVLDCQLVLEVFFSLFHYTYIFLE
ncbi:uncharacterized protein LOC127704208 isoform X1 [Mytilus californianus]|uniref:uncharacterized protein LOC127704208 isoform X1 n=1 Tax=Mytilus californianus TaxID=6549 RepID=UPI002245C354|nr:uncharacterized protein LOC127704208 isoform X1 [Mytilus californianus]